MNYNNLHALSSKKNVHVGPSNSSSNLLLIHDGKNQIVSIDDFAAASDVYITNGVSFYDGKGAVPIPDTMKTISNVDVSMSPGEQYHAIVDSVNGKSFSFRDKRSLDAFGNWNSSTVSQVRLTLPCLIYNGGAQE
jgi:hypothetical protein